MYARHLPALGAALFLLVSCGQSAPRGSGPTSSTEASASPPPTTSPASASTSPARSAKAPVTKAPVTKAPVTKAPVTKAPVTKAPGTKAPGTKAPGTKVPATKARDEAIKPVVVHIRNFAYLPEVVVIVGQPIEIVNDDTAAHTWSATPDAGWAYTSGNLEKNARATYPGFTKPGRYKFLCYYHAEMPSMNGVVTVRARP